jgi:hypothetical protein
MGILGVIILGSILLFTFRSLPTSVTPLSLTSSVIFYWFVIRGLSDALFTFVQWDSGMLALILVATFFEPKELNSSKKERVISNTPQS